ncbi:MAG: serine hydrolase domain-containing protein [Rubrivivax sp.]
MDPTPPPAPIEPAQVDAALRAVVEDPQRPLASLSALALRAGEVVYEGHFGLRSIEHGWPADGRTLYRIASVSKLVTALAVLQQVEAGRLDLDADAGEVLGFALRHPAHPGEPVTARMLMSHTSSLRDPGDLLAFQVGQTLADALTREPAWWAPEPRRSPAARWFQYANINQVVLGTMVERLTGQRFDLYVRRALLQPLGIRGGFHPATDLEPQDAADLATLYRGGLALPGGRPGDPWLAQGPERSGVRTPAVLRLDNYVVGSNAGVFGPQGALRVSVPGLARLMRMLLGQGELDGVRVLQPGSVELLLQRQWLYEEGGQGNEGEGGANGDPHHGLFLEWGLGVQRFGARSRAPAQPGWGDRVGGAQGRFSGVGHLGFAWGLLSGFIVDPASGNGLIYAVGGHSDDPDRYTGPVSAFSGWEERIQQALLAACGEPGFLAASG